MYCQDWYSSKEVIKTCKLTGKLCLNILHKAPNFTNAHKEMFPCQKVGKTFHHGMLSVPHNSVVCFLVNQKNAAINYLNLSDRPCMAKKAQFPWRTVWYLW